MANLDPNAPFALVRGTAWWEDSAPAQNVLCYYTWTSTANPATIKLNMFDGADTSILKLFSMPVGHVNSVDDLTLLATGTPGDTNTLTYSSFSIGTTYLIGAGQTTATADRQMYLMYPKVPGNYWVFGWNSSSTWQAWDANGTLIEEWDATLRGYLGVPPGSTYMVTGRNSYGRSLPTGPLNGS